MGDFEVDTRLEGGDGRYVARLSRDWEIWGPNGGYLAAIALRAAGREAGSQRPASFAGHFLSVARFAPVDVRVRVVRRGCRSEAMHVEICQEAKPILQALVRTAAEGPGLEHDAAAAPDVPDPEKLRNFEELRPGEPPFYPFWQNLEGRPLWPERRDAEPRPYEPLLREWFRFRPRATFDDPVAEGGLMGTSGHVWSRGRRLLASGGAQLMYVPAR
jgi:hypothetical protein